MRRISARLARSSSAAMLVLTFAIAALLANLADAIDPATPAMPTAPVMPVVMTVPQSMADIVPFTDNARNSRATDARAQQQKVAAAGSLPSQSGAEAISPPDEAGVNYDLRCGQPSSSAQLRPALHPRG